jgi:hypothetical protein
MPPDSFLHERSDFKALVETVAESEKINDPGPRGERLLDHALRFLRVSGSFSDSLKTSTFASNPSMDCSRYQSKSREAQAHRIETNVL